MRSLAFLLLGILLSACIPAHLAKYRQAQDKKNDGELDEPVGKLNDPDTSAMAGPKTATPSNPAKRGRLPARENPTIYTIDEQTFSFRMAQKTVWDAALDVLLRNYNLNIVDKTSGIITTEWDTFYLGSNVYRNKVSMRLQTTAMNRVEVMLHNSVEKLVDASSHGSVGAVWLPSPDAANETVRLIQNMAIALNEPPPYFPETMTAVKTDPKELKFKN